MSGREEGRLDTEALEHALESWHPDLASELTARNVVRRIFTASARRPHPHPRRTHKGSLSPSRASREDSTVSKSSTGIPAARPQCATGSLALLP
jgi:hypothetical protein